MKQINKFITSIQENKGKTYIVILFNIFVAYFLSIFLFVFSNAGVSDEKAIVGLFYKISFATSNYSVLLPFEIIKQGFFLEYLMLFLVSLLVMIVFTFLCYVAHLRTSLRKNLHGRADWSTMADLKKNNLLAKEGEGIVVGAYQKEILRFGGAEFCALGAPTRSGKGVGVVIPNLLDWEQSMVVLDVKQECFDITSKYRHDVMGHKVFLFDPFSYNTHRYNPLGYLNFKSDTIELDIQNMAEVLYFSEKSGDFFTKQAQSVFGAIAYLTLVLKTNDMLHNSFTLTTLAGALNGLELKGLNGETIEVSIQEAAYLAKEYDFMPKTVWSKFKSFFEQASAADQFAGVKASYETPLKAFEFEVFEKATEKNDFDFRNLRKEKTTIYIGITPDNIKTARPLLNLFFSQMLMENIKQGLPDTNPDIKYTCLMLMDEFTSIGYMEQYQLSITYMAGYKMRSLIIYQNDAQLAEDKPIGYGRNGSETLIENHACNVIYRPKKIETAEQISKKIGNITTNSKSTSSTNNLSLNVNSSEQQASRALILPQEILALKDDEEILFYNSVKIKCKKAFFYTRPYFMKKLKEVSPSLKAIEGLPNKSQLEAAYAKRETSIPLPDLRPKKETKEQKKITQDVVFRLPPPSN